MPTARKEKAISGFLTGLRVKPRKTNSKGETSNPSTIVFSIETANVADLLANLAKIQRGGAAINFEVEQSQAELDYTPGG